MNDLTKHEYGGYTFLSIFELEMDNSELESKDFSEPNLTSDCKWNLSSLNCHYSEFTTPLFHMQNT